MYQVTFQFENGDKPVVFSASPNITLLEAARGIGGRLSQNDAARLTRALVSADLLTQREGQLLQIGRAHV